jgi:hypothetical protein
MDHLESSDAALLQSIIDSAASHGPRAADATEESGREVR